MIISIINDIVIIIKLNELLDILYTVPFGTGGEKYLSKEEFTLQWRHNHHNQQPHDCLLKRLFGRRSKKTPKLRVTGLCEGNLPVTCEFPTQRASKAENIPIWWRHHKTM